MTARRTLKIIEEIWQNRDRDYNIRRLVKRLQRIDKKMSGDARDLFARFIPDGDVGRFAEDLPAQAARVDFDRHDEASSATRTSNTFSLDYPRPQRTFIVATAATDTVDSEWLIKGGDGKEYKPDDYLKLFAQFVRGQSRRDRGALDPACRSPTDWGAEALAGAA